MSLIRICRLDGTCVPEEARMVRCADLPDPHEVARSFWLYRDARTDDPTIIEMRTRVGEEASAPDILPYGKRTLNRYQYSTDGGLSFGFIYRMLEIEGEGYGRKRPPNHVIQEISAALGYDKDDTTAVTTPGVEPEPEGVVMREREKIINTTGCKTCQFYTSAPKVWCVLKKKPVLHDYLCRCHPVAYKLGWTEEQVENEILRRTDGGEGVRHGDV